MEKNINQFFVTGNILYDFLMMIMSILTLTACNEYEGDTLIVSDRSNLSLAVNIDEWGDTGSTRAGYSSISENNGNKVFGLSFTSGDAIGLFVCDKDGKVLVSNHKWTYSENEWTTESSIGYNEDYTYFAYYPWVSSLSGAPALNATPDISSAESFFASVISAWTPAADQSTVATFTGSDLMVSKGTIIQERQVAFMMEHQMALAVTQPTITYYDINDPSYTWTVTQSFTGKTPYQIGSNYYYFVKPGVETTIGSKVVNLESGQVEQLYFTNMEPGKVEYDGNTMILHSGNFKMGNSMTYQYTIDGGSTTSTKPSWLTVTANNVTGKPTKFVVSTTSATSTISRSQHAVPTPEETAILKANAVVNDIDLSMMNNDGTAREDGRTTANCYLVHAPGSYKIPLVYGNAIKHGNTNRNAYYTTQTKNTLQNFINHLKAGIYTGNDTDDPWIKNHSITITGAKLVWQDVQGMISSVGISGDYLIFTVDPDNIAPGNAVIAATTDDDGTERIAWSWHIWVTTETLSNLTTVATGSHNYQLAPVNLGWVPSIKLYTGHTCNIQVSDNSVTLSFDVTQRNGSEPWIGYGPYYEWGRKDPLLPGDIIKANRPAYTIDGSFSYDYRERNVTIASTIQVPSAHYKSPTTYGPYNTSKYNYWDAENTGIEDRSEATVKTIYDPCPPDFCVPTSNCFNYMTYSSDFKWTSPLFGRNWTKDGANVFFPCTGRRFTSESGAVEGAAASGYLWTATPGTSGTDSKGRCMTFYSYDVYFTSLDRSEGAAIRPVAEE